MFGSECGRLTHGQHQHSKGAANFKHAVELGVLLALFIYLLIKE